MKSVVLELCCLALLPIILAQTTQIPGVPIRGPILGTIQSIEKCISDEKAKTSIPCFSACVKRNDQVLVNNQINWSTVQQIAKKLTSNPLPLGASPPANLLKKLNATIATCQTQVQPQANECATAHKMDQCFLSQLPTLLNPF